MTDPTPGTLDFDAYLRERGLSAAACSAEDLEDLRTCAGCCAGLDESWDRFYRRFGPFMRLTASRLFRNADRAEDLVSSLFVELLEKGKIRQYNGRGSVRGWLRTVVVNRFLDDRRRGARTRLESIEDVVVPQAACQEEGCEKYFRKSVLEGITGLLEDTLAKLPVSRAGFVNLYYFQDATLAEAAGHLDVHESTACRWNVKILQKIRREIVHYMERTLGWSSRDIGDFLERCMGYLANRLEKARRSIFPEGDAP